MFSTYILDANAIRALKDNEILEKKNANRAIMTIEDVQHEVQRFHKQLKVLEIKPLNSNAFHKISDIINEHSCVRAVVDYINNKGAADVGLLAYSLTFNDGKLYNEDIYIVTNDTDLQIACKELDCKWITVNDFRNI